MFEIVLRWAWGTMLTAIVTAVLTMLLRHGKRWFRPVQKFLRTGRLTGHAHSKQTRGGQTRRSAPTVEREPRMTLARVLTALAQLAGQSPRAGAQVRPNNRVSNDPPLDLKF